MYFRSCALCLALAGHGAALAVDRDAGFQAKAETSSTSFTAAIKDMVNDKGIQDLMANGGRKHSAFMSEPANKAAIARFAADTRRAMHAGLKEKMRNGWKMFRERTNDANIADPTKLLEHARVALLQSGAMSEMRQMARASMNASRSMTKGSVPLDSMIVGFATGFAPWSNVLHSFGLPMIKARFELFSNFFGPEGNAARLCVSSVVAADSTYFKSKGSDFEGINLFAGPAKWDNVPGWGFSASGGMDDMKYFDATDFAWEWTLAKNPETIAFSFEASLISAEDLKLALVQTNSEAKSEAQSESKAEAIPVHASTGFGHTWCSPDWANTPLVLPEESPIAGLKTAEPYFKTEEWDPEAEAV
mmetsp:Transcript_65219/g.196856  ORF Transcript_65219/g.196856 Transcript_65219/m.196856 type:complete len:361 (-) Transcript_65219:166-1248(-)